MYRRLAFMAIFSLGLFTAISCTHDPIHTGEPNPTDTTGNSGRICDPDTVYFEQDILPLLVSSCAMSGCHDAASAQDGVVLTDYMKIIQTGDVKPGNPNNSDLYDVLIETNPNKIMPPPPASLTAAQVQLVKKWIQQGAKNNSCVSGCDTTLFTFSGTIKPMMQTFCVGCHSGASPSGYIQLDTHSGVVAACSNNRLIGAVKHQAGFSSMPPSGNPLTECQIRQIERWMAAGAPNN